MDSTRGVTGRSDIARWDLQRGPARDEPGNFWSSPPSLADEPAGGAGTGGAKPRTVWRDDRAVRLSLPFKSEPHSVTLTATSGEYSATQNWNVPAAGDDKFFADVRANVEALKATLEKSAADRKRRAEKLRQILPHWEKAADTMKDDGRLYLNGAFTLDETSTQTPEEVKVQARAVRGRGVGRGRRDAGTPGADVVHLLGLPQGQAAGDGPA